MTNATQLVTDFDKFVTTYGDFIRLKYYTVTSSGANYDDETYLTASGSAVWCMGRQNPLSTKWGSTDRKLVEQGIIIQNDSVLYLPGSISNINENTKIGIGSPIRNEFALIVDAGAHPSTLGSTTVFQKLYVRRLQTGSFVGEV